VAQDEQQLAELEELPEILGGAELPVPEPHAVLVTAGDDDDEVEVAEVAEE